MRDLFEDIFTPPPSDPMRAAQRAMRPPLKQRFYKRAEVIEGPEGFAVALDGRPARTPARHPLATPTRALGEALAAEWDAQGERIDPARMPLTRLANTIIDGVAAAAAEIGAEVEKYLGSDLVCYRAGSPEALVVRQARHWDPILAFADTRLGARFLVTEGVRFVAQPAAATAAARGAIPADPWRLGAVHAVVTLTGSALIALALAAGALTPAAAWAAAHVDEDWNMEQWGHDALALERRASRLAELQAAATVLDLVPVDSDE
ncbi:MAG TPA: ATP12 family protein [Xanthobacteraceae bacterium]|nr:ATP12 family protein [Xanthobacteraceae bacterium]